MSSVPRVCPVCKGSVDGQMCSQDDVPGVPSHDLVDGEANQGRTLSNRYVLLFPIGSGAAAQVYAAWDKEQMSQVAIKLIREPGNEEVEERFRREAIATKRFDHPNIVRMLGAGRDEDRGVYIVLEKLVGRTLDGLIAAEAPVSEDEAVRLIVPICEGLNAVHGASLIHRDLKPENIFVSRLDTGEEVVKLLDFGITRFVGKDPMDDSLAAERVLGSVAYVSPEQALREDLDQRSDLYALGALLYELLSGNPPFVFSDPLLTLKAHVEAEPPVLGSDLFPSLIALTESLLAKDRLQRPQTAVQVLAALDRIAAGIREAEEAARVEEALEEAPYLPGTQEAEKNLVKREAQAESLLDKSPRLKWIFAGAAGAAILLVGLFLVL